MAATPESCANYDSENLFIKTGLPLIVTVCGNGYFEQIYSFRRKLRAVTYYVIPFLYFDVKHVNLVEDMLLLLEVNELTSFKMSGTLKEFVETRHSSCVNARSIPPAV